jgi:hypothetical protein
MGPTEAEIDAVIFDMIAAEAARVPADTNLDDLWSSVARDAYGQFQGYGFGYTPAEARAGAWITAWWPECDLRAVRVSCRKAGRSRPTREVNHPQQPLTLATPSQPAARTARAPSRREE